jgi:predicted phosphodiesterase
MNTQSRIDKAFDGAINITFNSDDKIVIISDSHRGDNSFSDEFAQNQNIFIHALEYYYRNNYLLIENGDGEELWEHAKLKHIRFAHNDVYEILKKFHDDKRYVIIFGNHNIQFSKESYVKKHLFYCYDDLSDEKISLFPEIKVYPSAILKYENTGQELYVLHGHQGDFFNDQGWQVSRFFLRYFWRFMHVIGFKNPASPAKSIHKRHKIERKYVKWIKESHHMLIVGHTHRQKFSLPGQVPYFNSGSSVRPRYINTLEIVNGNIKLVEWRIWPDEDGRLQVMRRLNQGPVPIKDYIDHEVAN